MIKHQSNSIPRENRRGSYTLRVLLATLLAIVSTANVWAFFPEKPTSTFVEIDDVGYYLDESNHTAAIYEMDYKLTRCVIPETINVEGTSYTVNELILMNVDKSKQKVNIFLPKTVTKVGQISAVLQSHPWDDYRRDYIEIYESIDGQINLYVTADYPDIDMRYPFSDGEINIYLLCYDYNSFKEPKSYSTSYTFYQGYSDGKYYYSNPYTRYLKTTYPVIYMIPGTAASSRLNLTNAIEHSAGWDYFDNIYITNNA